MHLCFLGIHSWYKWEDAEKGDVISVTGGRVGTYINQRRRCIHYNKLQLREVRG